MSNVKDQQKTKRNVLKIRDVYAYFAANWLSGGRMLLMDKLSSIGIRPIYGSILTKRGATKVWAVTYIPTNFGDEEKGPINITHIIRSTMRRQFPNIDVNIMFNTTSIKDMNTSTDAFVRQLNEAFDMKEQFEQVFDSMSESERFTRKKITAPNGRSFYIRAEDFKKVKSLADSYKYVHDIKADGGEFGSVALYVLATSKNYNELITFGKALGNLLSGMGLGYIYINKLSKFLKNKCPAGINMDNSNKLGSTTLQSNENTASLLPFKTSGLVSNGSNGYLMGLDTRSGLPFIWDFDNSPSAQVLLFLAKSGYGKTYAAFQTILSLVGNSKHHAMVLDLKGNEWVRLKPFVTDCKVINIGGDNPRFVNTLRLDDLEVNRENAAYFFKSAVDDTVALLSLMVNLNQGEGNIVDLDSILRETVLKLYAQHGIDPGLPDTFKRTARLRYGDLLSVLSDLKQSSSYTEKQQILAQTAMVRCNNFISEQGSYALAMDNEVTVSEILNSKVVIFSLNKNRESALSVVDNIKVFMAVSLMLKKMGVRKDKGLYTDTVFEELQRCDSSLLDFVAGVVTGARSENAVVLLLLNSIATLMTSYENIDGEERKNRAIASNVTCKIIGKVEQGDIDMLVDHFGCQDIESELRAVADGDTHRNAFVASMDSGLERDTCVYRVVLPEGVSEQFVTRETREHTRDVRDAKLQEFLKG